MRLNQFLSILFIFFTSFAYSQNSQVIIQDYLEKNLESLQLDKSDVAEFLITDEVYSKSTKVTHVYIQQVYNGIEVFNGKANFNLLNDEVYSMGNRLVAQLKSKNQANQPAFQAKAAISKVADLLDLKITETPTLIETKSTNHSLFSKAGISLEDIPVKLVYLFVNDELRLAWDLSIYEIGAQNWWSVRLDAISGEILENNNWVKHCEFGTHDHNLCKNNHTTEAKTTQVQSSAPVVGVYNVFAIPLESPTHGPRSIVVDPEDLDASPFGWHDTNGSSGEEYTYTRGNNVYAYEDVNDNNSPGFAPEGTGTLNFDFPLDLSDNPDQYFEPSITNLFYMNNIMHDVWFQYGFDEASGNFQQNNYGNGGSSGDYVFAEAQDGSGINNANFATPPDGSNPRMQMYIWGSDSETGNDFTVNSPPSSTTLDISYINSLAEFGPNIPNQPITENLVLVEDGPGGDMYDACQSITNGADINGKIAVVRRGTCLFVEKVVAAQAEGAVAVIIINNVAGALITMGGDDNSINIPSLMLSQGQGQALIDALEDGDLVNGTIVHDNGGFPDFDSGFDNGIIAHEYGHGISTRLTGGRFDVECLFNEEQMGEGWSDWFGLMLTIEPGDASGDIRGIGTYVSGQTTQGNGIRPAPYSTNSAINDFTYAATNNSGISEPHGIGFVWATMLWDLTWAFIAEYGYDDDLYNGTGGNNMVMQLVIDGLKLQSCDPGFIDGRDAILEADMLVYDGVNQCLIWDVFANRGLGVDASQGSPYNRFDQTQSFNVPDNINDVVQDITLCYGESVFIGESEYDSPGTFVETIETENGCDQTITTNIYVVGDASLELLDEATISISNASVGSSYQWYNCEDNTAIEGATASSFTPDENGSYYVIVSLANCSNTSDCTELFALGIDEEVLTTILVYPNPTKDMLQVELGNNKVEKILITDVQGRLIYELNSISDSTILIDLSNEENGIYSLRIIKENGVEVKEILKH